MTERYTADDFANAQFAEHPETDTLAVQRNTGLCEWTVFDDDGYTGWVSTATMLEVGGWVPVPTKPTLTAGAAGRHSYILGSDVEIPRVIDYLEALGIEIIRDPEPTNADKIKAALAGVGIYVADRIAERLDGAGVTVDEEDTK